MKALKIIISAIIALFCTNISAQNGSQDTPGDEVKISLLTCAPSSASYFLYGHSALHIVDNNSRNDFVVNYGEFNWNTSYFVAKFTLGVMDYCMGIEPYYYFCDMYNRMGRRVVEQELNLTSEEKNDIMKMLAENYRPENREYRYNILYDNCTSRLRDIIERCVKGEIQYKPMEKMPTMRELVHKFNGKYHWESFGADLLLGIQADQPLSRKTYQFLPYNLMNDFDNADIISKDGSSRPLVLNKHVVVEGNEDVAMETPLPITPRECSLALLAITIAITVIEIFSKKKMWSYDAILMTTCGLAGILLFIMLFSDHPTVRINLQILILNPLLLFFVWRMIKRTRKNLPDRQYYMWTIFIVLFLIGGFFQDYAEGMYFVALSLLTRNISKLCFTRHYI